MRLALPYQLLLFTVLTACRTAAGDSVLQAAATDAASSQVCEHNGGTVLMLPDCKTPEHCLAAQDSDDVLNGLTKVPFCQIDRGYLPASTLALARQGRKPMATEFYLKHTAFEPNDHMNQPADFYCTQPSVGATLHMYLSPQNGQVAFCEFSDGSSIGDWTLYYGSGDDAPSHQQPLIKLLRSF